MSYPKPLEEYTMQEIVLEIQRREKCNYKGICSYCGRKQGEEPVCKFPNRHGRYDRAGKMP
jgi:hypothetical protein